MRRKILAWLASITLVATGASANEAPRPGLEILVFGATGKVGTHVVDEALARGHKVTAVSRDPSRISPQHANLTVVQGDLLDVPSVANLVEDRDVVVLSVRGLVGEDKVPESSLQYIAVRTIIRQLHGIGEGAARLIHVGGSGSLEVEPGVLWADKIPDLVVPKNIELEIQGQILALEYLRTVNDVEWTYVTPAKNFTNGERTGNFRIGGDELMEDERGRSRISRADFAVAILDEAELELHTGERVSVAY